MHDALRPFEQLEIEYIPSTAVRRRGPRSTHCAHVVARLIRSRGVEHVTIALRTIVESEGNEGELVSDTIGAVSDVIRAHPRWVGLGLQWLETFDAIDLAAIRRTAKVANVQPLRVGIATLIAVELEKILGPSKLPKQPRQVKPKREPKPARALTRIPEVERNIALGMARSRSGPPSNRIPHSATPAGGSSMLIRSMHAS